MVAKAITARPPTTPPTIAPMGTGDDVGDDVGDGVCEAGIGLGELGSEEDLGQYSEEQAGQQLTSSRRLDEKGECV